MKHLPIKSQNRSVLRHDSPGADYVLLPAESRSVDKSDVITGYRNTLRRRKWCIIAPILLILPLLVLSLYLEKTTYQASVRILIENTNAKILDIPDLVNQEMRSNNFFLTEYQIIQSEDNIGKVVDALGLDQKVEEPQGLAAKLQNAKNLLRQGVRFITTRVTALISPVPELSKPAVLDAAGLRRRAAIGAFSSALTIEPQPGEHLVDIVLSGDDPQEVALQVNTLAELYARNNLQKKLRAATSATEWLTSQIGALEQKMDNSELRLQQFREQGDRVTFDRGEQNSAVLADLQRLYTDYNAAKSAREDIENRWRNLTALARSDVNNLQTIPAYLEGHLIQALMDLRAQYQVLAIQRAESAKQYRPKHPVMARIDGQIDQIKRALREEFQKAVNALRAEYDTRLAREKALERDYNTKKTQSIGSRKDDMTYAALLREVESNRNLFWKTSERLREIELNQASAINNVQIIEPAKPPTTPVPSKAGIKIISGLLLAGCIGIGIAFIREYFDNRFQEADEVEPFLQIPFLGVVPHYAQGNGRAYDPVSLREPGSMASEAYRILRARIQATAPLMQTLLVASALPSEGKSTTTANLGIAFARLGLNILLVDIDLRRPSLHRHFWISNSEGLATALVDGSDWRPYLQETDLANLKVLPTGFNTHNPADLLSLNSTTDLLSQFKDNFDLVIFDGPIVLSIPDVEVIAPWMDGVVLVHDPGRCDKTSVLNAKMLLERGESNTLGVIFNNIRSQDQKYYYQQQTYYSQNKYPHAEQYDLGRADVRQLETPDAEIVSTNSFQDNSRTSVDIEAVDTKDKKSGEPIAIQLSRVIIKETIASERAGDQLTFLILELELCHTSLTPTEVLFRPESARVHLPNLTDPGKKIVYYDEIGEKIENGLTREVLVASHEAKKGIIVYRIPTEVPKCVLEYGDQRIEITIGF